jgi:outer membrane protein assembly factor BamB
VTFPKTVLVLAFITLFSTCKDVVFNNPLDPNASKEALRLIQVLKSGVSGKGDLAFDGEKIWKISDNGNLYALDMESGLTIRTIPSVYGSGLGFLQDTIYVCDGSNILQTLDPLSGDLLNQVSTTDLYPAYIAIAEGKLLLYDRRSASFLTFEPDTGEAERLFQVSGLSPGGIETFRGGILLTDTNTDSIYYFSYTGGVINVYRSPAAGITGITVDDRDYIYLFTLDGHIYKVTLP